MAHGRFRGLLLGMILFVCAQSARADFVMTSYLATLNEPNAALSAYAGPYAEIRAALGTSGTTDDRGKLKLELWGLPTNSPQYLVGSNGMFSFQSPIVSTVVVEDPLVGVCGGNNPPKPCWTASTGDFNISSFGKFNWTVDFHDGYTIANMWDKPVTLTLTLTTQPTTIDAVFQANTLGNRFAAHIFPVDRALETGFATESVPDSGLTLMMLGGGLVAVETLRRKLI